MGHHAPLRSPPSSPLKTSTDNDTTGSLYAISSDLRQIAKSKEFRAAREKVYKSGMQVLPAASVEHVEALGGGLCPLLSPHMKPSEGFLLFSAPDQEAEAQNFAAKLVKLFNYPVGIAPLVLGVCGQQDEQFAGTGIDGRWEDKDKRDDDDEGHAKHSKDTSSGDPVGVVHTATVSLDTLDAAPLLTTSVDCRSPNLFNKKVDERGAEGIVDLTIRPVGCTIVGCLIQMGTTDLKVLDVWLRPSFDTRGAHSFLVPIDLDNGVMVGTLPVSQPGKFENTAGKVAILQNVEFTQRYDIQGAVSGQHGPRVGTNFAIRAHEGDTGALFRDNGGKIAFNCEVCVPFSSREEGLFNDITLIANTATIAQRVVDGEPELLLTISHTDFHRAFRSPGASQHAKLRLEDQAITLEGIEGDDLPLIVGAAAQRKSQLFSQTNVEEQEPEDTYTSLSDKVAEKVEHAAQTFKKLAHEGVEKIKGGAGAAAR